MNTLQQTIETAWENRNSLSVVSGKSSAGIAVEQMIAELDAGRLMGVFIGQSKKIFDRASGKILYGRAPAGSVVVPGSLPASDGKYSLYCTVIVKRVDAKTRAKTSINELLRQD